MNRIPELKQQAIAKGQAGDLKGALKLLRNLERQGGMDEEAWFLLGSLNEQSNNPSEALRCFKAAVLLLPASARSQLGLARTLERGGRLLEAAQSIEAGLQSNPGSAELLQELGVLLFKQGRVEDALGRFQRALAADPSSVKASMGLGRAYFSQRNLDLARKYYEQVLKQHPDLGAAHFELGSICMIQGQLEEAGRHFQRTLDQDPGFVPALKELGYMHLMLNRPDDARRSFQAVLDRQPAEPDAAAGLAKVLDQQGKVQEAHDILRPWIERRARNLDIGIAYAQICRHFGECEAAADYLEWLLSECGPQASFQVDKAHFALGRLYDAAGRYPQAIEHFHQGNQARPNRFDPRGHLASIDHLIQVCDRHFLAGAPRASDRGERLLFIVGMPRSGTTLTEQILASHPAVYGGGELLAIARIIKRLGAPTILGPGTPYPENLRQLNQARLDQVAGAYRAEIETLDSQSPRFIDKTLANYLYLGLISMMFPGARIIHCLRDPRDTCLSIYFQGFDESHDYANRLENLGFYYRQYARSMRHWQESIDLPILEVQYEDLVGSQEAESRRLLEFAGLDWDPAVLRFHENRRSVSTASYDQVRRKIYTGSLQRWKHYADYIEPLQKALDGEWRFD